MQKKGGMRWQKRYFILYQSGSRPAHLAYFKDEKDDGARATLELTSDTKVDLLLGKAHAFQVILRGRALKVAAETHEDREKWMKCLRDCIAMAISQTMVHFSGTDWFVDPKSQCRVRCLHQEGRLRNSVHFHKISFERCEPRYNLLRKVGSGAYGFVVAAEDVVFSVVLICLS